MPNSKFFNHNDGTFSSLKTAVMIGLLCALLTWLLAIIGWMFGYPMDPNLFQYVLGFFGAPVAFRSIQMGIEKSGGLFKRRRSENTDSPEEDSPKNERKSGKSPVKPLAPIVESPIKATQNFNLSEFESSDGAKMSATIKKNVILLMEQLEIIREACGNKPITINSGYRSPKHNIAIGGAKNSQHIYGKAADFVVKGMSPKNVAKIIESLMDSGKIILGGLGTYKTWIHYDIRGTKTKWNG